jgi:hypothetical protein
MGSDNRPDAVAGPINHRHSQRGRQQRVGAPDASRFRPCSHHGVQQVLCVDPEKRIAFNEITQILQSAVDQAEASGFTGLSVQSMW